MALQKSVQMYPAIGVAGDPVIHGQSVYTAVNYVSDGTVKSAQFAFVGETDVNTNGLAQPVASATAEEGAMPLGLVERWFTGVIPYGSESTVTYLSGDGLQIAKRGTYYVEATGTATVGQAVLCNPTTGAVTYGTKGAENDTGWRVIKGGAEGDLIMIECWGAEVDHVGA